MINDRLKLLANTLGETRLKLDVEISDNFQTHLKGNIEAFYIATSPRELIQVIELCWELRINFVIIGSGSRITDIGDATLVIKNRSDGLKIFGVKGKISRNGLGIEEAFIEAGSGVSLSTLAAYTAKQGLGGLEELQSIPGTLGGAFHFVPQIKEMASQVKILTNSSPQKDVLPSEVNKEDIILAVTFHLKTRPIISN